MDNNSQKTTTSLAIVAIVAALALLGIVAITIVSIPQQQAQARGCESSWPHSGIGPGANASKLRCYGH